LKYCPECNRFIPQKKYICSRCGSSGISDFILLNREKKEIDKIILFVELLKSDDREYKIIEILGTGGYGIILKVKSVERKKLYALKLPLSFKNMFTNSGGYSEEELEGSEESIKSEISILEKFSGERLLKLEGTGEFVCRNGKLEGKFKGILLELAIGTLKDLILMESRGKVKVGFNEKIEISRQIIEDLQFLHLRNTVHRDIALENIFIVDRNNKINFVLGDFGTSKVRKIVKNSSTTKIIGKEKYLDPARFIKKYRTDPRIDMFTAGIVITEIFIGDLWDNIIFEPLSEMNFEEDFLKNYVSSHLDKKFIRFIAKSLKPEIEKRYRNTDEMKKKFEKLVKSVRKRKQSIKIRKDIKLLYNIKIPWEKQTGNRERIVDYENHCKLSFDSDEKLVINFKGVSISKVILKNTPFINISNSKNSIEISINRDFVKESLRIFLKKHYEKDKGILYFQNNLRIIYILSMTRYRRY